jgi:predicted RNase H-like HicB family nuclease
MATREEALAELGRVFQAIAAEYGEEGLSLPADSTAIVSA